MPVAHKGEWRPNDGEQAKQQKPSSYRHCKVCATGSQLPPPPSLLHRPPLHHLRLLSRSKSRRPGTTTFVFYSAAAIKLDQLKSRSLELSFFLYHVYHIERLDES